MSINRTKDYFPGDLIAASIPYGSRDVMMRNEVICVVLEVDPAMKTLLRVLIPDRGVFLVYPNRLVSRNE